MSFLRELMAYYTILESNVEGNGTKMAYNSGSEGEKSSFNNTSFDSHAIFNTSLASNCSIYGNMVGLTSLELVRNKNVCIYKVDCAIDSDLASLINRY